jgi:3-isopropylmalate dehydrogenase
MGAVGLPEFDNARPASVPNAVCSVSANPWAFSPICGPVRSYKALLDSSPLKNALVDGVDMIIVRELTGGIYYGTPKRHLRRRSRERRHVNTMAYTRAKSTASPAWLSNWPASAAGN